MARTASVDNGCGASGGGPSVGITACAACSVASGACSAVIDVGSMETVMPGSVSGDGNDDGAPADSSGTVTREGKALLVVAACSSSFVRIHSSPLSLMYTPHRSSNKLSSRFQVPRNLSDRSICGPHSGMHSRTSRMTMYRPPGDIKHGFLGPFHRKMKPPC